MPHQLSLLDDSPDERRKPDYLIPGLRYLLRALSSEEQIRVLAEIDNMPWRNELKRRVQHYGYKYDYKARAVNHSMYVGRLPSFAVEVAQQLMSNNLINELPDQLIVNEYQAGQGISAHVDCEPCFKDTVVTVSLGSAYEMDFISLELGRFVQRYLSPEVLWFYEAPRATSGSIASRLARAIVAFRAGVASRLHTGM